MVGLILGSDFASPLPHVLLSIGGIVSKISDNGTAWLSAQLLSLISGATDQTRDLAALGSYSSSLHLSMFDNRSSY